MIMVVDYGMGNLRSVEKAFESQGARVAVSDSPKALARAGKIVLPGVGAFDHAVTGLKKRKLTDLLKKKIQSGVPYLGLCLGLQLLFERSEEGRLEGLGLLKGTVRRFRGALKIPHMGWNTVHFKKQSPIFKGLSTDDYFYFVHSFYPKPVDASVIAAETEYGVRFCSSVWKDNIFATQFHPEKSQSSGLRIIQNFAAL